jgi:hypothetical protein
MNEPIKEKYVEERIGGYFFEFGGEWVDSVDNSLTPERYNDLVEKYVELAREFSKTAPKSFDKYWYKN